MSKLSSTSGGGGIASGANDPFYTARRQLEASIEKTSAAFEQWKYILENENTAASSKFSNLTRDINLDLNSIDVDITNLGRVITAIENHRAQFRHIDDAELDSRRKFVNAMATRARTIKDFMESARSKKKIERDQRSDLMTFTRAAGAAGTGAGARGAETVQQRRQVQAQREADQDAVLNDMSSALDRLQGTSTQIQGKLVTQSVLIDEMQQDAETSQNLMSTSMAKMDALLAKSRAGKLCCIVVLAIIVIVLFFLIIYF